MVESSKLHRAYQLLKQLAVDESGGPARLKPGRDFPSRYQHIAQLTGVKPQTIIELVQFFYDNATSFYPLFWKELAKRYPNLQVFKDIFYEFDMPHQDHFEMNPLFALYGITEPAEIQTVLSRIAEMKSQHRNLTTFEICFALLHKETERTLEDFQNGAKEIDLKYFSSLKRIEGNKGPKYLELGSIGRIKFSRTDSSSIAFFENLIRPLIDKFWRSFKGENLRGIRNFFNQAVFELLKNAYKHSKDKTAYFEWKIDYPAKTIYVRVINSSYTPYRPSDEHLNKYVGKCIEEVYWDFSEQTARVSFDPNRFSPKYKWGGFDRGVPIARYHSTSLTYIPIYDKETGAYFGTGAIATYRFPDE